MAVFIIYRRAVGATSFRALTSRGLAVRTVLYVALAALIAAATVSHPLEIAFDAAGVIAGAAVAFVAIRTSTFSQAGESWRYRPHPWIGIGLFVFFVGRVAFDIVSQPSAVTTNTAASPVTLASLSADPVSAALLLVIVGYYLVYNVFLLRRARSLGV